MTGYYTLSHLLLLLMPFLPSSFFNKLCSVEQVKVHFFFVGTGLLSIHYRINKVKVFFFQYSSH